MDHIEIETYLCPRTQQDHINYLYDCKDQQDTLVDKTPWYLTLLRRIFSDPKLRLIIQIALTFFL